MSGDARILRAGFGEAALWPPGFAHPTASGRSPPGSQYPVAQASVARMLAVLRDIDRVSRNRDYGYSIQSVSQVVVPRCTCRIQRHVDVIDERK